MEETTPTFCCVFNFLKGKNKSKYSKDVQNNKPQACTFPHFIKIFTSDTELLVA